MPTPLTEIEWPGWLFYEFFDIRSNTATIADGVNAFSSVARYQIDSKVMRKVDEGMILFGSFELVTELGTASVRFDAQTRLLFKLP